MAQLKLFLFCPPYLERNGETIPIHRRKILALLAYLAVTKQYHSRDALATLLWPEYNQARARANLRRELSLLKQALNENLLEIDREQIGLHPEVNLWLDIDYFRQQVAITINHAHTEDQICAECLAHLTEAASCHRSDFLAGFSLPDSREFDEWQFFQAEELRQALTTVLTRLIRLHSLKGEFEPAILYARRWLGLDTLHEPAHQLMMKLYAWSGQQSAAFRQYEECVRLLHEELGLAPEESTTRLYQAIKARHLPRPDEVAEQTKGDNSTPTTSFLSYVISPPPQLSGREVLSSGGQQLVFVARERELAQLDDFFALAQAGQGRVVFVTGEAGTGKTALVEEFAQRAQKRHPDLIVANGICHAYTGIGDPYLPFREILALLTGDVEARWAARVISREQTQRLWALIPDSVQMLVKAGSDLIDIFIPGPALGTRAAAVGPRGAAWLGQLEELVARKETGLEQANLKQSDLFEQYTRVLQLLAQRRPLLLTLDDLQWADSGSINLLFHLGRRLEGHRILVVGIYRPAELIPGRPLSSLGYRERHPLESVVNEFQRHFGPIKVDLRQAEDQQFVEELLDLEPNLLSPAFRQALYHHTRGHALFTLEILRDLQERRDLVQDEMGRWIEGSNVNWETLPARVEGVIGERFGRLPTELREVLKVASVQGEEFTAEVVAQVLGVDEQEVVRQLSSVLDRQHRLVKSQGSQRLEAGGQRLSHYRFRHILFQRYLYKSLDEVERAYLHESVGNMLETLYGSRTEEIAVQLAWHFQEAEVTEKAVTYLLQTGNRAIQLSANSEAIGHLNQALELLEKLPGTPRRIRLELDLQLALGSATFVSKGFAAPEAEKAYARALELCRQMEETPQLFPVLWGLHEVYMFQADFQKTLEASERCMRIAQRAQDPGLLLQAHHALWSTFFFFGDLSSVLEHAEQGVALYDPEQHRGHTFLYGGHDPGLCCRWMGAFALCLLGYPDQARSRIQEAVTMAQERPHSFNLAGSLINAANLHQLRREGQTTQEHAEATITISTEREIATLVAEGTIMQGWALAEQGQAEEGIALIRRGIVGWEATGIAVRRPQHLGLLAEAYGKAGQLEEGLAVLAEALAAANKTGERWWEAELYRLKGEFLLKNEARKTKDELSPDEYFWRAIDIARRQKARLLELRAVMSLSRLWHIRGSADKREEARQLLVEIYGWFSEGFDLPDLKEARTLIEEMR